MTCKTVFTIVFSIKLARECNEHPSHASRNLNILFLTSLLPILTSLLPIPGGYRHWSLLISETFQAGFDEILRGIQAEAREFVSYKKT